MPTLANRSVAIWLLVCCAMILIMALLGAVTRLTESGLSITDWNPVMGAVPPHNAAAWDRAFAAYKEIPQYQILHRGMTLIEFKHIYFWEWLHRLWGRLIGLAFALPFAWFLLKKQIARPLVPRLAALLALGALQGLIGWIMVKSGLSVRTSVSPYRLALHLGFALFIYALMFWTALDLLAPRTVRISAPLRRMGWMALGLLAVTMIWGAFAAGLHAGGVYNTWPLMEGDVVPSAAFTLMPKWVNALENPALVQFIHRWLGPATMLFILAWVYCCASAVKAPERGWFYAAGAMALLQVALGIATLLTHAEIALATLHQAGAIALLSLLLINLWRISRGRVA